MSASVWDATTGDLLRRVSSADPTPGGGAIAAVSAAFGVALLHMAIEVTVASPGGERGPVGLADAGARTRRLRDLVADAADRDVSEFDGLMAAYRMARGTEAERAARAQAIAAATVTATVGPLTLAEACVDAIALAAEIEPLVKPTIVSDVQAGRDLVRGATRAALRTADINISALVAREHPEAFTLRARRDAAWRAVADDGEPCPPA